MRRATRAGAIGGILAAALLGGAAVPAQNSTTIVPAPGAEHYSLPPGASQTTPAPTPTPAPAPVQAPSAPTPTLTPAPPPSVVPSLQIPRTTSIPATSPAVTDEPQAAPGLTPSRRRFPRSVQTPAPESSSAVPVGGDVAAPAPEAAPPAAIETAVAPSPAVPEDAPPWWLWWAIGVGVGIVVLLGAIVARRRFGGDAEAEEFDDVSAEPAATPVPPSPSPPARPNAGATAVPQPTRALALDFRAQRLWTRGPDAFLAFELIVTNTGAGPVDGVRPVIVLASAGPDTAADIAAFNANAPEVSGGETFALRAGETRSIAGELTLPGDSMYVTTAADRELIVPLALINLQWRAGASRAQAAEAFVIGTGDATAPRLGPIWVDRPGLVYAKLDARRFTPRTG